MTAPILTPKTTADLRAECEHLLQELAPRTIDELRELCAVDQNLAIDEATLNRYEALCFVIGD
ncbi:TPA: hypothetical protein JAJ90_002434 [Corynebacterium striatum]|nr:hypothetical protein [Corynebacterium striatum]NHY35125.1 hypothetical protein [Corynebacterium striatum]HAT6405924.1 hypothetical protein [Corynebacterium striatum]HAT6419801.1 hypothetical protein [Corynebacterium striatum]HAT6434057.1 hypothetical protein [Corynebacterium striatum]